MSVVAAPAGRAAGSPGRLSRLRTFFTLIVATLATTMTAAFALWGLDSALGGSLVSSTGGVRPDFRMSWPVLADNVWSHGLDALVSLVVIAASAALIRYALSDRAQLPMWAVLLASAAIILLPGRASAVAAIAAAIVLPRLPPGGRPRHRSLRARLLGVLGIATAFFGLVAGTLYAANRHPIIADPNASCGFATGDRVEQPLNRTAGPGTPFRFAYWSGHRVVPGLCLLNRAPTRNATVLGVAGDRVTPGPWRLRLVRWTDFDRAAPFTMRPHATGQAFAEVRFTACTASETGRQFTLSAIPLRVRVGGALQVASIALPNPIQTRC